MENATPIKLARINSGLSFRRAAKAADVDLSTIVRYERPGRHDYSAAILCRMADAYQCSVDQLLGRTSAQD